MLEKELRANWDAVFYPQPEPEVETFGEEVQAVDDPVLLAAGPSGTMTDGGAAVGVFPQMRPRRAGASEVGASLPLLAADVAAGTGKGLVSGSVGLAGDVLAIGRGLYEIGKRGGDESRIDAFLRGLQEGTVLPTSDDVDKWLTQNIGPVVPPDSPIQGAREAAAGVGRLAGEVVADPFVAVKGAKAAAKGAKALAPKAGEMVINALEKTGTPVRGLKIIQPGPSLKDAAARQAENVIKKIDPEEQTVLFHSGDASIDEKLKQGIEPGFGDWLNEVLSGSTDDADLARQIKNQEPIAFYSETPDWVAMKVARILKKPVSQVTEDDIRKHGQLSVVVVDKNDRNIWRENGKGEADQFQGKGRFTMSDIPFGVERGDIFTTDAFVPDVTLTGESLVEFLKKNAPGTNNLEPPVRNSRK